MGVRSCRMWAAIPRSLTLSRCALLRTSTAVESALRALRNLAHERTTAIALREQLLPRLKGMTKKKRGGDASAKAVTEAAKELAGVLTKRS